MSKANSPRLVVGISGASGVVYGARVLDACRELGVETHLIVSRAALITLAEETDLTPAELSAKADVVYRVGDIGAAVASGSFPTLGMIIAPCSVRTMSEIASGVTSSLLTRAADVTLKEARRLVLMVRETPLHLGHLRTMAALAEMGAVIAPPMPAFYARPAGLEDMIDQSVGRALDLFGLDWGRVRRWGGDLATPAPGEGEAGGLTLWGYAAAVWRRPDVEPLCLELQDAHGQSPPLLIWRLWTIGERRPVDAGLVERAIAATRHWEAAVTAPLRAARRGLKDPAPLIADDARTHLREAARVIELEAEHVLLDALEAATPPPDGTAGDGLTALVAVATAWRGPAPAAILERLIDAAR